MDNKERHARLYSIGSFAKLTGVTERTLRYYDRQGLLKPSERNAQGHRYYSDTDIMQLQRILTLKYLDFSLDEISVHMSEEDQDFKQILANQYLLLQKKHQQLERVMKTIERMQSIVSKVDKIDRNLLLVFIHHIQHEESQRAWLSELLPEEAVDALFMMDATEEEKLEAESQITSVIVRLLELHRKGKKPTDDEVLLVGKEFIEITQMTLKKIYESLTEEQLERFIEIGEKNMFDPLIFPSNFTKEEQDFLDQLLMHVNELTEQGGKSNEGSRFFSAH